MKWRYMICIEIASQAKIIRYEIVILDRQP